MRLTALSLALAATLVSVAPPLSAQTTVPVRFRAHDIARIQGGYAVAVADFNGDNRIDVMANSVGAGRDVAWYQNPSWRRVVIVPQAARVVNQAIADIDGDGIPEVAYQSEFAMQAANSEGVNSIARSGGDPNGTWRTEVVDRFETSHHVQWADFDGDGVLELVNAPLIGPGSLAPTYDQDQAPVFWYDQATWTRHTIDDGIPGIIHRVRPYKWDGGDRDALLVASFEGIALYQPTGSGSSMRFTKTLISPGHVDAAPRLGASDVGAWTNSDGRRVVASVEPWHGNEVVVYTQHDGEWKRRVIFDAVQSGHEIAVLDLNGDGLADIVANDNSRVTEQRPDATPGVHVFFSPRDPANGEWIYRRIESQAAMNGCVGADMNRDGAPDLVCTGAGGFIRWYENMGR
jgi:hypothetical protein